MAFSEVPDRSWLHAPPPDWAADRLPDLEDEVARHRLYWIVGLLLAAGVLVFLARGGSTPPDPVVDAASARSLVPGFDQIGFRVRPAPTRPDAGTLAKKERCALLAETQEQRVRGMTGLSDFRGYAGMVFRFPTDSVATFHMSKVKIPLAIAWFNADGHFVGSTTMTPCPKGGGCRQYAAPQPYRLAIEVARGRLAALGIGPGSRLVLEGTCAGPPGSVAGVRR